MNNNRKLKIKKMMKKGATISLCAVLAGGIGVGAYEGVDYFTGAQSVQAATDSSEKLTLMKSDKKSDKSTEDTTDTKSSDTKGSLDVSEVAEEAMRQARSRKFRAVVPVLSSVRQNRSF